MQNIEKDKIEQAFSMIDLGCGTGTVSKTVKDCFPNVPLNTGGIFINVDVVLGSDETLQNINMEKWKAFMISRQEVEQKWIPAYHAEDRPATLISHMDMLKICGFESIDVAFKYYNYAVYCGKK